jgi:hypothetical protein
MKRDYRIRDYRDTVTCRWCEKPFIPLMRYCPHCAHTNEDFQKYALHNEAQQFVELWIDPEVHRTMVELAKEKTKKLHVLYQEAVEFYITALNTK